MIPFVKMHGIGNDFVMIDGFEHAIDDDLPELSRAMCHRRFGIGADGLIVARPGRDEPFQMRMFNPDGTESEMCGNGVRCFALFLRDEGKTNERVIPVETGAGRLVLEAIGEDRVRVDMGLARLTREEIGILGDASERFVGEEIAVPGFTGRGTAVSMGNPHVVFFIDDPQALDLERVGPAIEHHPLFPNRINAHFVRVAARDHLIQRTWERGAGATLACGTGACAAAVAAIENGLADAQVRIDLPGGTLEIEVAPDRRVFMTGPAQTVFRGEFSMPYARSPKAAAMAASP